MEEGLGSQGGAIAGTNAEWASTDAWYPMRAVDRALVRLACRCTTTSGLDRMHQSRPLLRLSRRPVAGALMTKSAKGDHQHQQDLRWGPTAVLLSPCLGCLCRPLMVSYRRTLGSAQLWPWLWWPAAVHAVCAPRAPMSASSVHLMLSPPHAPARLHAFSLIIMILVLM